ncbi:hypothetical protein X777_08232 [Ooceraea biroi]|uniref:Uncharacterized protein n=1 Tax=Ooceraea biroi TaxID=2015173 RepID=A0A026WY74_OOCBI|nr:hypothetical protein X777_08232 [Ooceraea biroi]
MVNSTCEINRIILNFQAVRPRRMNGCWTHFQARQFGNDLALFGTLSKLKQARR